MPSEEVNQEVGQQEIEVPPSAESAGTDQAQQQEVTPPDAQASDDAAFEQGFNAAQGIEDQPPAAEPEKEEPPAYTPEMVKELMDTVQTLKQREAKVFGTIGALKQQIDALKSQPQTPQKAFSLQADGLKRLKAEFPELAELIAADLTESMQTGQAQVDPSQMTQLVEQAVSERLENKSREFEAKLLTAMHPDWRAVVKTPEFATWKQSIPEEDRDQFDNSWDAEYLSGKFSEFKDWKSKAVQQTQSRQNRLENAITPRGGAKLPPPPSDDEAFAAGFISVRGKS